MNRARGLGIEGEARAARLLEADGWSILARNARCDRVEIDLVAQRGDTVAFVEVKTRRGSGHGAPEEAIDWHKRRRLVRGAAAWLHEHRVHAREVRFDVISCELDARGEWRLRHLEDAFDAGES
jgi:putative endonuclease